MRNRLYWGLGILIILLIATTTVVVIRSNKETQRLRDELEQLEVEKQAENMPHAVDFSETKPPDVPGFVWVRHGDHWDKVPIDALDTWQGESHQTQPKTEPDTSPVTTYKNNGEYVDIDYSVFDNPEELIAKIGDILLNPEKYSQEEYDRAIQESVILNAKFRAGYYGKGQYREELEELKNKTYGDEILNRGWGISREELRAMIRGDIPPLIVPINPAVLKVIDGGDK